MKIITNRGQAFEANFAHAPTLKGSCVIELKDARSIMEIAEDFDGLVTIRKESESEGDATYAGYDMLVSVIRKPKDGTALLTLERSDSNV